MEKVDVTYRKSSHPWQVRYQEQYNDPETCKSFKTEAEADAFMAKFKVYEITLPGFHGDTDGTDHLVKWIVADHMPKVEVIEIDLPLNSPGIDYTLV